MYGVHIFSFQLSSFGLIMPLKTPLLMFLFILLLSLSFHFEWKVDKDLRSLWRQTLVLANSLSPSKNPFREDDRREKRPVVTDQRLRDESLQREFEKDLVS